MRTGFYDRAEAGRMLAARLEKYCGRADLLVLGLARGGVPVAFEIARSLNAPLDVFVVRKLGCPSQEELALGAIGSGGVRVINSEVACRFTDAAIDEITRREEAELKRREVLYRGGRDPVAICGKTVLLVDDGIATGASLRAGAAALRKHQPARLVIAAPVGPPSSCSIVERAADEVVMLAVPPDFRCVGEWYSDYPQTSDGEVGMLLDRARRIKPA